MNSRLTGILTLFFLAVGNYLTEDLGDKRSGSVEGPGSNPFMGAVDLAKEQDHQARDRFTLGVANNLEVVRAKEALASANDSYISSLYSYTLAKVFLARAVGETEKNVGTGSSE